jgi:hypothetical protein
MDRLTPMSYDQQAMNLAIVVQVLTFVVGAVVLYFVIRLAVTHAIRATREKPGPVALPPSHVDEDGL